MRPLNTILTKTLVFVGLIGFSITAQAQNEKDSTGRAPVVQMAQDTVGTAPRQAIDLLPGGSKDILPLTATDTMPKKQKRDWSTWRPSPKRAMWLALVLPGAGQIYNRKFWKLPIFYGGFVGCAYAMRWNNMMYRDYSQAYLDIMDDDPTTQSYNQFLHLGNQITKENMARWQEIFRKRKDRYRRWRDLGFFVLIGVYALSVVDAYVDASLSEFDISPDLSMHVSPAVINGGLDRNPFKGSAIGLQCSLSF